MAIPRFTNTECKGTRVGILKIKTMNRIHGLRNTAEHQTWRSIKYRCYNKAGKDYKHYGGRGIILSDEFKNDFLAFYTYIKTIENYNLWLTDKNYSLDRIDNDGMYERGNLRFSIKSVQALNTRIYKNNTSGYKGVSYVPRDRKYVSYVRENGKQKSLGHYHTAEAANIARQQYFTPQIQIPHN